MGISITVGRHDGSERVVSSNLKSVELASRQAASIAARLRAVAAGVACVRVYTGATVHLSVDVALAA